MSVAVFSLRFSSSVPPSFAVQARAADGAEVDLSWSCPLGPDEFAGLIADPILGRGMVAGAGKRDITLRNPPPGFDPAALGRRLFQSLFAGKILQLWHRSLGSSGSDADLKLELSFDPADQRAMELFSLPWELLHDGRDFLVLSRRPVVRRLRVEQKAPAEPLPAGKLRILAAVLSSRDLDVEAELAGLRKLEGEGCEIVPLDKQPVEKIRERLEGDDFQVLHLIGHGGWHEGREAWGLDCDGDVFWPAEALAEQLCRRTGRTRLVVLNACLTGRVIQPGRGAADAGVATALVERGVPAVIAMQSPISDSAAIVFSSSLYGQMAQGKDVSPALDGARLDLRAAELRQQTLTGEFAIPVLFDRTSGRLREAPPARRRRLLAALLGAAAVAGLTFAAFFGTPAAAGAPLGCWGKRLAGSPLLTQAELRVAGGELEPASRASLETLLAERGLQLVFRAAEAASTGSPPACLAYSVDLTLLPRGEGVALEAEVWKFGRRLTTLSDPAGRDVHQTWERFFEQLELLLDGRPPAAASALADPSSSTSRLFEEAQERLAAGETAAAIELLRQALEDDGDEPSLYHGIGRFLEEWASQRLLEADNLPPGSAAEEMRAAALGALRQGVRQLDVAIGQSSANSKHYYQRARIREALEDIDGAFADYRQALGLQPDFPHAANDMARLHLELGDPQEARGLLERARAAVDPDDRSTHAAILKNLARARWKLGDPAAAESLLQQALEQVPEQRHWLRAEILALQAELAGELHGPESACRAWAKYESEAAGDPAVERQQKAARALADCRDLMATGAASAAPRPALR
jgi:tetratricopeptide (TPR) repeat protein